MGPHVSNIDRFESIYYARPHYDAGYDLSEAKEVLKMNATGGLSLHQHHKEDAPLNESWLNDNDDALVSIKIRH